MPPKTFIDGIAALPPLRDIVRTHDLRARQALGQNFLLDLNLTARIARVAEDLSQGTVIEIGPGPGGLTRALLQAGARHVIAIERDPRCVAALQSLYEAAGGRLDIIEADALTVDVSTLGTPPRHIIANLPYNIATPLAIRWFKQSHAVADMVLMFQREVAERLCAAPGNKAYGRLSVMAQWVSTPCIVLDIPPQAFTPPPTVRSSVVHFTVRQNPVVPMDTAPFSLTFLTALEEVTRLAFAQRRKMIGSRLATLGIALEETAIDPRLRPDALSVADYGHLAALSCSVHNAPHNKKTSPNKWGGPS